MKRPIKMTAAAQISTMRIFSFKTVIDAIVVMNAATPSLNANASPTVNAVSKLKFNKKSWAQPNRLRPMIRNPSGGSIRHRHWRGLWHGECISNQISVIAYVVNPRAKKSALSDVSLLYSCLLHMFPTAYTNAAKTRAVRAPKSTAVVIDRRASFDFDFDFCLSRIPATTKKLSSGCKC